METKEIREKLRGIDVPLEELEKAYILHILEICGWDQVSAAKKLGIGRATLWRKLRGWEIKPLKKRRQ